MKSTSGYAFLFGSSICSWLSKKQSVVAQPTAEAEYVSAYKATSQAIWLSRTFEDIGEMLDLSPNTVAGRYRYGMEKLRTRLKGKNYEPLESHRESAGITEMETASALA